MNIVLDLWFVVGLDMGVAGVAKIMGVTFGLWLVHRTARQLNGRWSFAKTLENEKLLRMFLLNRDIFIHLFQCPTKRHHFSVKYDPASIYDF